MILFGGNSLILVICTYISMKFFEKYQFLSLLWVWGAQRISDLPLWNVDNSTDIEVVVEFANLCNQVHPKESPIASRGS